MGKISTKAKPLKRCVFLFAPGAGAPSTHPWMLKWASLLGTLGEVILFDYPYMNESIKDGRRRPPNSFPVLVKHHTEKVQDLLNTVEENVDVVLVGKSMGSRVGCHVAVELGKKKAILPNRISKIVCFGFPLIGANGKRRNEVLSELAQVHGVKAMFFAGTRDKMCPPDDLQHTLQTKESYVQDSMTVVTIDGGDHSLEVSKKTKKGQSDVDKEMLGHIKEFLS